MGLKDQDNLEDNLEKSVCAKFEVCMAACEKLALKKPVSYKWPVATDDMGY